MPNDKRPKTAKKRDNKRKNADSENQPQKHMKLLMPVALTLLIATIGIIVQLRNEPQNDRLYWQNKIDDIHAEIENDVEAALKKYELTIKENPLESLYGKAKALDFLAEIKQSNAVLQKSIGFYTQLINHPNVSDYLLMTASERCINRMQFIGQHLRAIPIHKKLIERFPDNKTFRNDLSITYLTVNKINEAKQVLLETLQKWPDDGVALVHHGFILKTTDNKLDEAVDYLKKGIQTKAPGVIDGRFYFHLGDALSRLGKVDEAMDVYEEGVKNGIFLSKYQRSLYNVNRLKAKPWWDRNETPYETFFKLLETNYEKIMDEGLSLLNKDGNFQDESENLKDSGDWKQLELFARGIKNVNNCKKCPITCKIIESMPDAKGCRRGQSKFSVMHPGTHVWPHCGPTNCRLRAHLGLKVPSNTFIRVAEETRSWEQGKLFIFDDSFEHEVWHNGSDTRLILIVDVWHPELTPHEKKTLSSI